MALFNRTKSEKLAPEASTKKSTSTPVVTAGRNLSSVIIKPRITEKAIGQNEKNVYVFIVRKDATKYQIADAVSALYNVTPVKVNTVSKAPRQTMSRSKGRVVTQKGMKKAYVYLKPGDTITLV